MKNLIFLLMFPCICYSQYKNDYKEINVGYYYAIDGGIGANEGLIFPGASFLWGNTVFYNNNTMLDYQLGIAFPTIVTCKLGYGIGNEDFAFIAGLRPFPTTIYLQFNIQKLSFSFEPFLLYRDDNPFRTSLGKPVLFNEEYFQNILDIHLVTFGYRF